MFAQNKLLDNQKAHARQTVAKNYFMKKIKIKIRHGVGLVTAGGRQN